MMLATIIKTISAIMHFIKETLVGDKKLTDIASEHPFATFMIFVNIIGFCIFIYVTEVAFRDARIIYELREEQRVTVGELTNLKKLHTECKETVDLLQFNMMLPVEPSDDTPVNK